MARRADLDGAAADIGRWIALDPALGQPIYRQIYQRLRDAVLEGRLAPGTRLPSWNDLAAGLGVARGTVRQAYEWLAGEGFIVSGGAAGTRVNPDLPAAAALAPARRAATPGPDPLAQPWGAVPLPFQMGIPALDAFPRALWCRLAARRARTLPAEAMVYQDPLGLPALRRAIAAYLGIARGVACDADQVLVTAGYTGALDLVTRALLHPGDDAWIEDPGYPRARAALALAGMRPVPVPVDGDGLDVAAGVRAAAQARLALVTPSHQAPLGMALSLPRRLALLEWAEAAGAWIVEDDYYSEFSRSGRPLPALKSLDRAGRVFYAGTFSKALLPGLRVGYLVVPEPAAAQVRQVASLLVPPPLPAVQATIADFMDEGHFARHVRRMRTLYAERRAALAGALAERFGPQGLDGAGEAGMHLLMRLPPGTDDVALVARATAAGLAPAPLSSWFAGAAARPGLMMNFANIPAAAAPGIAGRLAAALGDRACLPSRHSRASGNPSRGSAWAPLSRG